MSRGLRLGSIGGVPLEVGASWLIVLPIVALAVYAGQGDHGSAIARAIAAGMGAIGVLASILLHEAAHAWAARRTGIRVERVAVFLLGGFSEMDLDRARPTEERQIAVAGPALSVLLGAGLVVLGSRRTGPATIPDVLRLLGLVNLGVAGFNLLPAFPLDGGRVVRSILMGRGMGSDDAARIAARIGLGLGGVVFVVGVAVSLVAPDAGPVIVVAGLLIIGVSGSVVRSAASEKI